jgi:hypothetical protein
MLQRSISVLAVANSMTSYACLTGVLLAFDLQKKPSQYTRYAVDRDEFLIGKGSLISGNARAKSNYPDV